MHGDGSRLARPKWKYLNAVAFRSLCCTAATPLLLFEQQLEPLRSHRRCTVGKKTERGDGSCQMHSIGRCNHRDRRPTPGAQRNVAAWLRSVLSISGTAISKWPPNMSSLPRNLDQNGSRLPSPIW